MNVGARLVRARAGSILRQDFSRRSLSYGRQDGRQASRAPAMSRVVCDRFLTRAGVCRIWLLGDREMGSLTPGSAFRQKTETGDPLRARFPHECMADDRALPRLLWFRL